MMWTLPQLVCALMSSRTNRARSHHSSVLAFIRSIVIVTGRALRFQRVRATTHVLLVRDRFEVVRIDACPLPTEVIKFKTIWHRSNQNGIDHDVSAPSSALPAHLAVTAGEAGFTPQPTASAGLWVDLDPDAFRKAKVAPFGRATLQHVDSSPVGHAPEALARLRGRSHAGYQR